VATITIIAVPPGEAPEWVRREWVGMILSVMEARDLPPTGEEVGVLGGPPTNPGGYPVETTVAIKELEKKSPKAAEWWKSHLDIPRMPALVFQKDVCVFDPR